MAGAGRVGLLRARALRQLLRLEPPVARRACWTCSRFCKKPLAALRVDGATVERACEATGCKIPFILAPFFCHPALGSLHAPCHVQVSLMQPRRHPSPSASSPASRAASLSLHFISPVLPRSAC